MRVPSTPSLAATALLLGVLGCSAKTMAKPEGRNGCGSERHQHDDGSRHGKG
jgi:hypothetical protein